MLLLTRAVLSVLAVIQHCWKLLW